MGFHDTRYLKMFMGKPHVFSSNIKALEMVMLLKVAGPVPYTEEQSKER